MNKTSFSTTLDTQLKEELQEASEASGMTISQIVEDALRVYLPTLERLSEQRAKMLGQSTKGK